jgi:hypothetical protein
MHTYFFYFLNEKNISYTGFAFHSKNTQINFRVKYLKKYKGPANKFKNVHKYFWNFLISKKTWLDNKIKRGGIKRIKHKGVFCQTHRWSKID